MSDDDAVMHLDIDIATGFDGYRRTGNAMYVWFALQAALVKGGPIPEWIIDYLGCVARNLLQQPRKAPGRVGPAVQKALFGEKAKPFKTFRDDFIREFVGAEAECELGQSERLDGAVKTPAAGADEAVRRVQESICTYAGYTIDRRRVKDRYSHWLEQIEAEGEKS